MNFYAAYVKFSIKTGFKRSKSLILDASNCIMVINNDFFVNGVNNA